MNDLLMLGKAFNHERETDSLGRACWDTILIDAPATGHGLTFFKFPKVIRDVVPAGNMHRETDEMWNLLVDPSRTTIHLVAIPEELPIQETIELHSALKNELGLPIGRIFLNRFPESPFSPEVQERFLELTPPSETESIKTVWENARMHIFRRKQAEEHRRTLQELSKHIVNIPEIFSNEMGRSDLDNPIEVLKSEAAAQ